MPSTHVTERVFSNPPDTLDSKTEFRQRLAKMSAIVGVVVLVPVLLLVWFLWPVSPNDALARTRQSFGNVDRALKAGDGTPALRALAELDRNLDLFRRSVERNPPPKNATPERRQQYFDYMGEFCRYKSMYIRDTVFAQAAALGTPIPETNDASTGERFRSYALLPQEAMQQSDSIALLRKAAAHLPGDLELVTETLRAELMLRPISWNHVQSLAEATLKLRPEDPRSLYLLARVEFEQPTAEDPTKSTPPIRRNSARIRKSVEYLGQLKKTPNYPPWRVAYLEAKIHTWTLEDALRRGDDVASKNAQAAINAILWGERGMIRRAHDGVGLSGPLSGWDVEGVLGMFERGIALASFAPTSAERTRQALNVYREIAKFSEPRQGRNTTDLSPASIAAGMMNVLLSADRLLAVESRNEWRGMLDTFQKRWQPDMEKGLLTPQVVCAFADECRLEARRQRPTAPSKAETLETQATIWVETALQNAAVKKLPLGASVPLHASAAYAKIAAGMPRATYVPHLQAISSSTDASVKATGNILEGYALVRAGSLDQANEKLELLRRDLDADRMLPAHLLFNEIYVGTANADKLVVSLRHFLLRSLDDPDHINTSERVWLADLAPDIRRMYYLMAQAHLDLARDKHYRFTLKSPGQEPPADLWSNHLREVGELTKKLLPNSPYRIYLMQLDSLCAQSLGQTARAFGTLEVLRGMPEERLASVALAVALAFPPGNGNRQHANELEKIFDEKLRQDPADPASRLGMALILARTGRSLKAIETLAAFNHRPEIHGDRLMIEQIDLLAQLALQADRPELWKALRPLFADALTRYPIEPRSALALGLAEAALGAHEPALRELQRAANLAGCRNSRFTSLDRERMTTSAQRALTRISR